MVALGLVHEKKRYFDSLQSRRVLHAASPVIALWPCTYKTPRLLTYCKHQQSVLSEHCNVKQPNPQGQAGYRGSLRCLSGSYRVATYVCGYYYCYGPQASMNKGGNRCHRKIKPEEFFYNIKEKNGNIGAGGGEARNAFGSRYRKFGISIH